MILTCPACDTKYVVKDGAIPPGGRQVRCAACKNAWHQAPDAIDVENDDAMAATPPAEPRLGGPPLPSETEDYAVPAVGDVPPMAADEPMVSDDDEPDAASKQPDPAPEPAWPANKARFAPLAAGTGYGLTAPSLARSETAEPPAELPPAGAEPQLDADDSQAWDEEQHFISSIDDEEERGGRGLKIALVLLLLVAAAAAALWFLAPASFKERIGLADASATPLEVMLTTSDRQKLASGNELLAISGRVINPTDAEQAIPPIRASLRNRATRKLVYQWTIAPPARSLPPRGSASFNSAEVDIPQGGDELTVTLGGAAI